MLQLSEQPARIINHNTRNEHHGDELVLAGDLKLSVVCRAEALRAFDSQLDTFLFRKRLEGDGAVQTDISATADPEISRRLPQLDPLRWSEKFPGNKLTIVKGMGLAKPIVLPMRTLQDFTFEPLDGGLVKITFRASGEYESTAVSGELDGLQQREVEITIEPPKADAVATTQPDLLAGEKSVLVTGVELATSASDHLTRATVGLSGGADHTVGEWAYRPTLDEIAIALHELLDASVEFTPSARSAYENAAA